MGYATKTIVVEVADMDADMIMFWQTLYDSVLAEYKYVNKLSGTELGKIICLPTSDQVRASHISDWARRQMSYMYRLVRGSLLNNRISVSPPEWPIGALSTEIVSDGRGETVLVPLGGALLQIVKILLCFEHISLMFSSGGKDSLVVWQQCVEKGMDPIWLYCADGDGFTRELVVHADNHVLPFNSGLYEFEGSDRLQHIVRLSSSKLVIGAQLNGIYDFLL
jgi:hypothetical protein